MYFRTISSNLLRGLQIEVHILPKMELQLVSSWFIQEGIFPATQGPQVSEGHPHSIWLFAKQSAGTAAVQVLKGPSKICPINCFTFCNKLLICPIIFAVSQIVLSIFSCFSLLSILP